LTRATALLAIMAATLAGCAGARMHYGRPLVGSQIESRTSHTLGPAPNPGDPCIPPGVNGDDGLLEDEAVAVALWNNAAYQELLAELGLTRADVIEAAQLTNPTFSTMLPVGVKQLEFALTVPLEAIWLRPCRMAAAQRRSQEMANRLVQDGLDLIRDVRLAYADLLLAEDLRQIAVENVELRGRIAGLADARVQAGSASQLDASASRIDEMVERQQAAQLQHQVELARQRLRTLMGVELGGVGLEPVPTTIPDLPADVNALVGEALVGRPDLWAAELACEAARYRATLARRDYFHLAAMLPDANGDGEKGFEAGPGLVFTVPVFHQNQGAIARADAEVERAERHCVTVRHQVALEVRQAYTRCVQAREALETWDQRIVPAVEDAVVKAEKAYQAGGTSLLLMLETSRRRLDSQVERAQAAAEQRRAAAELERSVGGRVFDHRDAALAFMENNAALGAVEELP